MKISKTLIVSTLLLLISVLDYSQSVLLSVISSLGTSFQKNNINISCSGRNTILHSFNDDNSSFNASHKQALATNLEQFKEAWSAFLYTKLAKDFFCLEYKFQAEDIFLNNHRVT